jgi:hypothetical protein
MWLFPLHVNVFSINLSLFDLSGQENSPLYDSRIKANPYPMAMALQPPPELNMTMRAFPPVQSSGQPQTNDLFLNLNLLPYACSNSSIVIDIV